MTNDGFLKQLRRRKRLRIRSVAAFGARARSTEHRIDKLNANNWFNNANRVKLQPERRNVFGFTVGGPIRKDKTFFFYDYEGQRQRNMATGRTGVPSANMREGDFGEICAQSGGTFSESGRCSAAKGQIWDPYGGLAEGRYAASRRRQQIRDRAPAKDRPYLGAPRLGGRFLQEIGPRYPSRARSA